MNISAFLGYLNKTRGYHLDADYSGQIETWRQWWKGSVPGVHTRSAEYCDGKHTRLLASLKMPKRVCEDWANLLLNDRTTFQIADEKTAAYLLGSDEQQVGGLLRELHFWDNANKLVEQAYWSGTGAFVLSVTGVKGTRFQQALSEQGVCVSVKSACSSDGLPSRAVFAVSRDRKNALSSWRISLSHLTTQEELDGFLRAFDACYTRLTQL